MADFVKTSLPHIVGTTDGEKPIYLRDPAPGQSPSNIKVEEFDVEIENIRGKEDSVSLDTAGFQYFHAETNLKSFMNDEEIEKVYYPESIELLKRLTGASRIVIFDHSKSYIPSEIELRPKHYTALAYSCSETPPGRDRRPPGKTPTCPSRACRPDISRCDCPGASPPAC